MDDVLSTSKKDNLGTLVLVGSVLVLFVVVIVSAVWQTVQFHKTIDFLKSLSPSAIHELRIYPRNNRATGVHFIFSPPDALIHDFLRAIADIQGYRGSTGGILSADHEWFVEIETTEGRLIHMECNLPANKKSVVYGDLGRFPKQGGGKYYGRFQSEMLFQWYQQHSNRWIDKKKSDEGTTLIRP